MCVCVCWGGTHLVRAAVGILAGGRERKREIEERGMGGDEKGGPVCWTGDPISSNRGTETDLVKRGGLNTVD